MSTMQTIILGVTLTIVLITILDHNFRIQLSNIRNYLNRKEKQRIKELEDEVSIISIIVKEYKKKEKEEIKLRNDLLEKFINEKNDDKTKKLLNKSKEVRENL